MIVFSAATLIPALMIGLGALNGGVLVWLALAFMTAVIALGDELTPPTAPGPLGKGAGTALSILLALGHFVVLTLVILALASRIGHLGLGEKLALFSAAGLFFGQVSNSNAHELIHRAPRLLRALGGWVYISLLFGHHRSAHLLVHHVRVATRDDPASARKGESFYRYVRRAWSGGFRDGAMAETARLRRAGRSTWQHPYIVYVAGAGLMLALSLTLAGPVGLWAHLSLAGFAQLQLLMSDYVQHYGLERADDTSGRPEPVGVRHSWNSPHRLSTALMLNAPRHSDHHIRPGQPFPELDLQPGMPTLPRSLPVMSCLALWPRQWRRVMDPRVAALADQHGQSAAVLAKARD